jgi:ribosome-binding factor A
MAHRIERLNSLIRQEISELLQQQVKDPRLDNNFVAVTEVITSPDLKSSRVFVSSISTEEEKKKVLKALSSASGFLRRELSRRLKLRYTPELIFQWDNSIERGDHLLKLIDEVSGETDT